MSTTNSIYRARRWRVPQQRGAALLEAVIASLLLATLALGGAEYGSLYAKALDLSNAVRAGAFAGSVAADNGTADADAILAILNSRGTDARDIERVVIYKLNTGPGNTVDIAFKPETCSNGDTCNSYAFAPGAFAGVGENKLPEKILAGREYYGWPETTRQRGTDFLGIWVKMRRPPVQGLVWSPQVLSDKANALLAPAASSAGGITHPGGFQQSPNISIPSNIDRADYTSNLGKKYFDDSGSDGDGWAGSPGT